jgi:hypothetical protein
MVRHGPFKKFCPIQTVLVVNLLGRNFTVPDHPIKRFFGNIQEPRDILYR